MTPVPTLRTFPHYSGSQSFSIQNYYDLLPLAETSLMYSRAGCGARDGLPCVLTKLLQKLLIPINDR
jgi:hypothetical protein